MHAGVVALRVRPDRASEAVRIYRVPVSPELKGMRGFGGGYALTDAERGKGCIIGLWRTQGDAEGFQGGGAFGERAAKLGDVPAEAPSREVHEVCVQA